ncbi:unnamed protein product [Polarella glacialis]|uniref:Kringle domain-containing protein n=1 Tax=Polarella glacialis TaxID=89957 RepID=A0A813GCQ7_POLGL|nr:unnamed protein product [Polarella glacialis]|mmetsp:Transcript_13646/g.24581  ORF Transcript_13646/g.24581 Transcript_13646/m.24581 type:complete len:928 (-) Transcript_13646:47-2830(-)
MAEGEPESTQKFVKGGQNDISAGPIQQRRCTDILCLVIFLVHWLGFMAVTFAGVKDGDPRKLYKPRDFMGGYCGINDFEGQPKLLMTMNVSIMVDQVAEQLVCSSSARNSLQAIMSHSEYSQYLCACCIVPCGSCTSNLGLVDISDPNDVSGVIGGRMSELTDLSKASELMSSGSNNAMSFSASKIWSEATKYFVSVCMSDSCKIPAVNSSTAGVRNYTYSPAPDVTWKMAWDTLASNPSVPAGIRSTINSSFTFFALPSSRCPYEAMYCVPFPGLAFTDASMDYCTPKIASAVSGALGSATSAALEGSAMSAISEASTASVGSAAGDLMATLDAFCVVAFLSFVVSLVFMVLLRFLIGTVVWASLFLVFAFLVIGGGILYVRSYQCAGSGLVQTGLSTGVAVAVVVQTTAVNKATGAATVSEAMTGSGWDYRGAQTRTRSGILCQKWDSQYPHEGTWNATYYPNRGLEGNNYCRNPGNASTIWCQTTDEEVLWELCSPVGIIIEGCTNGFQVGDERIRKALEIVAYILWGLAGIWFLIVVLLNKRIRLAIAVNKVAAQFVYNNPLILAVPIVQIVIAFFWLLVWMSCASFILSQVPTGYVPSESFATYAEAYGTNTVPGKCTDKWPTGFVWKSSGDLSATNDTCSGNMGNVSGMVPACWKCGDPRYVMDARFAYVFFTLLWNNAFLVAIGQCVVAGAVAGWFFMHKDDRGKLPCIRAAVKRTFRYHLGSLAFGAFILAVVQFIRYLMKYLEKQGQAQKNRLMVLILRIVGCCLWCLEKFIKFLNKNAYIQVAIMGTNFCTSAKNAFSLITRNMLRFGVVAILGSVVHAIGFTFIVVTTTGLGYLILQAMEPDISPTFPVLSYLLCGYLMAMLFMNIFSMAVDTSLQCFIAAEEMGVAKDFVPGPLQSLVNSNPSKPKVDVTRVAAE